MPTAVTRLEMRTRVRSLANMETASALSFVTDSEINGWLDDGIRHLYDKLVHSRGADYYRVQSASVALVPGTAIYALPATYYQVLAVVLFDGQHYYKPRKFQSEELADLLNMQSTGGGLADIKYCLTPTAVEFRPVPSGAGWSFFVLHVPAFTTLAADGSTFDGVNGWEDWAILWAAIRCLAKEESDTGPLQQQLQMTDQRILSLAPMRDSNATARVRDTRGDVTGSVPAALRALFKVP
jgi:hypothetical protein